MNCFKANPFWKASEVPPDQTWRKKFTTRKQQRKLRRQKKKSIRSAITFWKAHPGYKKLRDEVFRRDGYRCRYCGAGGQGVRLEMDHVIPRWKGGKNDRANLVCACRGCNQGKGGNPSGWVPNPRLKGE